MPCTRRPCVSGAASGAAGGGASSTQNLRSSCCGLFWIDSLRALAASLADTLLISLRFCVEERKLRDPPSPGVPLGSFLAPLGVRRGASLPVHMHRRRQDNTRKTTHGKDRPSNSVQCRVNLHALARPGTRMSQGGSLPSLMSSSSAARAARIARFAGSTYAPFFALRRSAFSASLISVSPAGSGSSASCVTCKK